MTEAQITEAEGRFGLKFPPDYRTFLGALHTMDPEMAGFRFQGQMPVAHTGREFSDWLGDAEPIIKALEWPVDGLLWSIEADSSWHPNWGPRPDTKDGRAADVRCERR
jgi:hypothetical protein